MSFAKPKVILAAGAFRSGSTWLYNAIRLILLAGGAKVSSGWVDDIRLDSTRQSDYLLVKIHEPSDSWRVRAWRIFTSHRDLRDVARSSSDFLKIQDTDGLLKCAETAMSHHAYWAEHAHCDVPYELIESGADRLLQDIVLSLGIEIATIDILAIRNELESMQEPVNAASYDSTSLLHPVHRFGGRSGDWAKRLTPEQAELIARKYQAWMRTYGYIL